MRKIESLMLAAIEARKAWHNGNTAVSPCTRQDGKPLAEVFLHGNHIATIGYDRADGYVKNISVTLAGWNTVTTRNRLSAIIRAYAANGPHGLGISTRGGSRGGRDGQAALHDATGKRDIDNNEWINVGLAG